MAAIAAASAGSQVTVCEQLNQPGAKLLASGGSKCNLTNVLPTMELSGRFGRQGRFMLPALNLLSPDALRRFFAERGVATITEDGFHVFPKSNKASDILKVLLGECSTLGVKIETSAQVTGLKLANNRIAGVIMSDRQRSAEKVIIATGGKGYPVLGGRGIGYMLAEQAGHDIVTPLPALVGLRTVEAWPGQCAGISFSAVSVMINLPKYRHPTAGELLFTHRGISGPAVIDLGGDISQLLQNCSSVPLAINLFADKNSTYWLEKFNEWQQKSGKKHLRNLLAQNMPQAIADVMCANAGLQEGAKAAEFNAAAREKLYQQLTAMPLRINATEGWEKAMVTRGGVALKKISPDTLESRLVSGLFFAGEVLDLDGPCGGYNLQWAFASGFLAGTNAIA